MGKLIKGGTIGGLILFIWSAVSWMFIPWHMATMHTFTNPAIVSQAITSNAATSGIYFLPAMGGTESAAVSANSPMVFAAVSLTGMASMTTAMVTALVLQIVLAFLVMWLLSKTREMSYGNKLWFILVFAFTASIFANLPYWNWFGFSASYTLVMIADALVGWLLAGLAMAKIAK